MMINPTVDTPTVKLGTLTKSEWEAGFGPWRSVMMLCGGLLILASVFKGLQIGKEVGTDWWFSFGLISSEWVLGWILILGIRPLLFWRVTLAVFIVFALIAIKKAINGEFNCGCFGQIEIKPVYMAIVDGVAVVFLALVRPPKRMKMVMSKKGAVISMFGISLLTLTLGGGLFAFNPAYFEKSVLPPEEMLVVDLGYIQPNSSHPIEFKIKNDAPVDLEIKKIKSECDCTEIIDPPKNILKGEKGKFEGIFEAPNIKANYQKRVFIHTNYMPREKITLLVKARIGLPLVVKPNKVKVPLMVKALVEADEKNSEDHGDNNKKIKKPKVPKPGHIWVQNDGDKPVKVLYATSSNPKVFAKIGRIEIKPKGKAEIRILTKPESKVGEKATIRLRTNHKEQKDLSFEVEVVKPKPNVEKKN